MGGTTGINQLAEASSGFTSCLTNNKNGMVMTEKQETATPINHKDLLMTKA
ncbi:hypothetical protein DSOL_3977 [Desulfosporosinus metallidurans]|uniref:Uncharacterized protein n=1 Tax=Desulfosporosinus metallidurans TaxID=1888891 RepID=A0A1Q8QMP5_9FIRM|nr:hypothetical protein DSOL_3977 [Desulfosporosinus metallidurans]